MIYRNSSFASPADGNFDGLWRWLGKAALASIPSTAIRCRVLELEAVNAGLVSIIGLCVSCHNPPLNPPSLFYLLLCVLICSSYTPIPPYLSVSLAYVLHASRFLILSFSRSLSLIGCCVLTFVSFVLLTRVCCRTHPCVSCSPHLHSKHP